MVRGLLETTVARLVEPIGRRLEAVVDRGARRTASVTAALCVGIGGMGFFSAALYLTFLPTLGAAGAAAGVGGLLVALAAGILLLARSKAEAPPPPRQPAVADQIQDLVTIALAVADGFAAGRDSRRGAKAE